MPIVNKLMTISDDSIIPIDEFKIKTPNLDMCSCSDCGHAGKVEDFPLEWNDPDDWFGRSYLIPYCPKCEEGGCVDDFWPSEESLKRYENRLKEGV